MPKETKIWKYDGKKKVPKDVTKVVVQQGVERIPEYAFKKCTQLVYIHIPDSMNEIGRGAFSECTSLQSIQLPSTIYDIEAYTFSSCTSLKTVNLKDLPLQGISEFTFDKCSSLSSIQFPLILECIGKKAFMGCTSLQTINLPKSVEYLDEECFSHCTSLTSVSLPFNVQKFDPLKNCTSIKSIRYHPSQESLDFEDCLYDALFLSYSIHDCPEVARRPCVDDLVLPLHFCLMCGLAMTSPDHFIRIIAAAPNALCVRDPIYHMYPFLLAACCPPWRYTDSDYSIDDDNYFEMDEPKSENKSQLECIYMLLHEAPHVMTFLLRNLDNAI